MKIFAFILCTILLTIGIPLAAMNVPFLKDIDLTNALAYILGFLTITSAVVVGIIQYHIDTVQQLQKKILGAEELNQQKFLESVNRLQLAIQDMNEVIVFPVDRDLVYDRLKRYIVEAKRRADLMYFGSHPPSYYLKSQTKDEFVDTLDTTIASEKKNVRQIILYTSGNKEWIRSLVDKHRGNQRFSLAVIETYSAYPLASVQLFDDETVVVMNLDTNESPNKPRDLVIQSKKIFSIFDSYYQAMYKSAVPIANNGIINNDNYERYF